VNDPLRGAAERLRAAGIESSRAEARILWLHARKGGQSSFAFDQLIGRRLAHEPVSYITGHREFWSLDFQVGPGVLIPRPATETLVEQALAELRERDRPYRVLDLGTGSACLIIALLKELPNAKGIAVDCSEDALIWAGRNLAAHGQLNRCILVNGNWEGTKGRFDLIVSNPPYIPTDQMISLLADVRDYEPAAALNGGPDGMEAYRTLTPLMQRCLRPNGVGLLEIGVGQHHIVKQIVEAEGLKVPRIAADLAGIPRCLVVRR